MSFLIKHESLFLNLILNWPGPVLILQLGCYSKLLFFYMFQKNTDVSWRNFTVTGGLKNYLRSQQKKEKVVTTD